MLTLIKHASVYSPVYLGEKDILLAFDKIAYISECIECIEILKKYECEVIEGSGKLVLPGFIDQHVHMIGGGGEGGFSSRTCEVGITDLVENGITTVVGVLGVDGITRSLEGLYAKSRELESEGVSTYIYSGSYQLPVLTMTGSIQRDLALIDKVVGVGEIAIADHRSFQPTAEELARIAAEARNGGMISGKAGVVHLHVGDGPEGLNLIFKAIRQSAIPLRHFIPTHINRNSIVLKHALELLELGGFADMTAGFDDKDKASGCMPAPNALKFFVDSGAPIGNITMSSDGNGSIPEFDSRGELIGIKAGSCKVLLDDVRKAVLEFNMPLEQVLKTVTINPARVLRLDRFKGSIAQGKHADLVLMDKSLNVETVFSMGRKVVEGGKYIRQEVS
jgi:beta-aspartyl-dipeptidase (metallo-type)